MPVIPVPASGGAAIIPYLKKSIRMLRFGCRNRPFYHIVVMDTTKDKGDRCIEQVGSFDPMPNEKKEIIVAFNYERIRYWMGEGAALSDRTAELLGLSGFLPIHPRCYMQAWRSRGEDYAQEVSDKYERKQQEIMQKALKLREERAAEEAAQKADEEAAMAEGQEEQEANA